ncbi:MAG: protein kinase family protein, partial [Nocardioidaceae bacterium]
AWSTMTYYGNPRLGGLKSGVGLVVDLGKPQKLGSVQLTLGGSPTSVEILGAPGSTTAPTSASGLKTLASADGAGTTADLTLKAPVTTRYFVVWLTSLPQGAGGYQGHVAEIVPKS